MWVEPITDRAQSDITSRTAKAFFNLADWLRIHGNTAEVQTLISDLFGLDVSLISLSEPTITTFPTVGAVNALIENIERLRDGACLPVATGATVLKHDYAAGNGAAAPDYNAVNQWERVLEILHRLIPIVAEYSVHCGVAAVGQPRFWQSRFRG